MNACIAQDVTLSSETYAGSCLNGCSGGVAEIQARRKFPDTYYPYPMGLPNFCYHLAIKEMAINGKIRLVSLVVYNYILPRKTGKCNNLPRCGVSSDLTEHMAHLVQAAVWTAGLDDRLADSGLIPF